MHKKNIVIWGGNGKELTLNNLDSHASVNAFFLTKYLSPYYNIFNINSIDDAERILNYQNIHAVISTSQYGFTNRLINKGRKKLFLQIRSHVKGRLCSIADFNESRNYYEDILFCVRPISKKNLNKSKKYNSNFKAVCSGWCADPNVFYPVKTKKNEFNIFIDHAPYSSGSMNYVPFYFKILKKVIKSNPHTTYNVYHQNNDGIIKWNFNQQYNLNMLYNRKIKVPYDEIIRVIKNIHIFCYTHKESAGLSGIEAASTGSKLYIPTDIYGRTFIKKDLLKSNIDYKILYPISLLYKKEFDRDSVSGIDKSVNHRKFKQSQNTWEKAAKTIHETIK